MASVLDCGRLRGGDLRRGRERAECEGFVGSEVTRAGGERGLGGAKGGMWTCTYGFGSVQPQSRGREKKNKPRAKNNLKETKDRNGKTTTTTTTTGPQEIRVDAEQPHHAGIAGLSGNRISRIPPLLLVNRATQVRVRVPTSRAKVLVPKTPRRQRETAVWFLLRVHRASHRIASHRIASPPRCWSLEGGDASYVRIYGHLHSALRYMTVAIRLYRLDRQLPNFPLHHRSRPANLSPPPDAPPHHPWLPIGRPGASSALLSISNIHANSGGGVPRKLATTLAQPSQTLQRGLLAGPGFFGRPRLRTLKIGLAGLTGHGIEHSALSYGAGVTGSH
ncbi:hypothetical protein B2J93_8459 [Marssonina coronariae]|uniref:Uncharacterized protein n=1 Tax=Diplocarpon coronariae TaxID=2795749 RepID=A0A218YYN3_9HELO|nr:hypothetical protein B2J93_8459 [Marssonina coronariae]